jgi:hypothetical protein
MCCAEEKLLCCAVPPVEVTAGAMAKRSVGTWSRSGKVLFPEGWPHSHSAWDWVSKGSMSSLSMGASQQLAHCGDGILPKQASQMMLCVCSAAAAAAVVQ